MTKENKELYDLVLKMNSQLNERFDQMEDRFEKLEDRFELMDEKIDNLTTETRSYFKRLDERMDTLVGVIQKLSFNTLENDVKIEKLKQRFDQ